MKDCMIRTRRRTLLLCFLFAFGTLLTTELSDAMGLTANPLMKINLGHQEVERLIEEMEAVYHSTPMEWLPVRPIAQFLTVDLGYEDEGEFEDALNGTFLDFLRALPNIEVRKTNTPAPAVQIVNKKIRTNSDGESAPANGTLDASLAAAAAAEEEETGERTRKISTSANSVEDTTSIPMTAVSSNDEGDGEGAGTTEEWEFKIKPEPEQSAWKGKKMTVMIKERSQLWNVLLKSAYARLEIPHMEFEISADGKRKIDTLYNHIGSAIFNLGSHIAGQGDKISEAHQEAYADCILGLNRLLDVDRPWEMVVYDPSGLSDFSSLDDVQIEDI